MAYDHRAIEKKWQLYWESQHTFRVADESHKPKYYVLDMFPYPSADGLHVGHLEGYTASDIVARYKRMRGFHVLHPMGWDSFGLPAEQYAIKVKQHPAEITRANIQRFKEQIQSVGFSYDWSRELATSDAGFYRWTQWLFLTLYERGLAYEAKMMVNYCPELKTVLANEEVINGRSERGHHPVIRIPMKQWVLKITAYAERLLEDLEAVDWPEHVKEMQRNWIGKSPGASILFELESDFGNLEVFTTRADTLMGVTFMALAPEHPLIQTVLKRFPTLEKLRDDISKMQNTPERERETGTKQKLGIELPIKAIHPITQERIPVWVANYVLMAYGTGAIMAVPAHDERDLSFAQTYDIPVVQVISDDGMMINSHAFNGLPSERGKEAVVKALSQLGRGKFEVRYRMRDWIFSRQRYWGEPIPILHFEDGTSRPLDTTELPLLLPEVDSYEPAGDGKSPLAAVKNWVHVRDPKSGKMAERDTHTMPQWAGSCWYYLRFLDPSNTSAPWDPQKEKFWMPVDLYIGGVEHATLHLLYARFWHKVFYDCGLVSTREPFTKLVNQGMILGEDNEKMSKSRGNVINPDDLIATYGADSVRLYEMFLGPLEMVKPWKSDGIIGVYRFLNRVYQVTEKDGPITVSPNRPDLGELKRLHACIQKVSEDLEHFKFNTAIAEMMSFTHFVYERKTISRETLGGFVKLLCPFAPHLAEEIWSWLGHKSCASLESWPEFDPKLTERQTVTLAVQVNGKLKGTLEAPNHSSQEEVLRLLEQNEKLAPWIHHPNRLKTIVVPNKVINIVIRF
jgi:leucyl-tRNA synthetase